MIVNYIDSQTDLYKRMAKAYYDLVISLSDDVVLKNGLGEGLNKFLSNAYIKSIKQLRKNKKYFTANKYLTSHFISIKAHEMIKDNNFVWKNIKDKLRFEHIIPKEMYQSTMYEGIRNKELTEKDVEEMLKKYWIIATITTKEDKSIALKKKMPEDWTYSDDKENLQIRYSAQYNKKGKKIEIIENPYLKDLFIEL